MLYNDFRKSLKVGRKYSFTFRAAKSGEFEHFHDVTCINIYHKKATATFEMHNGVKRSVRLISVFEVNGENIYL